MKILLLEPFFTGSHAAWANEYAERSSHDVTVLGLEGRHWKWRMHGGAVELAEQYLASEYSADLILASDMLDFATFLALTRGATSDTPSALYFHENQLSYPWSEADRDPELERDHHYGFINITSALAADRVFFNSRFHKDSFLESVNDFLSRMPDHALPDCASRIGEKSSVLHLGLDLARFNKYRGDVDRSGSPLILWNHRWEYDKNPQEFFRLLDILAGEGHDFKVAILGESFSRVPEIFEQARERLGERVVQYGYVDSFQEYARFLLRADILPVTSIHDFFGASVVQATYCDCCPILPARLAYPEHLPSGQSFFYSDFDSLLTITRLRLIDIEATRSISTRDHVSHYDWSEMAPAYDSALSGAIS